MKITKGQLRRIIREYGTDAERAMMRGRYPSIKKSYNAMSDAGKIVCPNCGHHNDAGVDKCSNCGHPRKEGNWKKVASEMKITKEQLRRIIKEEKAQLLSEAMNPAMVEIENELRHTLAEYIDTYMMSMNMNPGDPADRRRVSRRVDDIVSTIIGN